MGSLWAIWHWPSSIQRGDTATWIAFGFLGSVGLRILIVWLYNNTGESVFAAITFHAMANVGKTVFPGGVSYYDPPERVALWGTSLGGGHVIGVAADDPRIAAVVAQVPFNGFPKSVEGRSAMATLRLLGASVTDAIRGWLGFPPAYIPVVGSTGDLAVMASTHAQQTIDSMRSGHWRNEVAPRILFEMMRYKPSARAQRLKMTRPGVHRGIRSRNAGGFSTSDSGRGTAESRPRLHPDLIERKCL